MNIQAAINTAKALGIIIGTAVLVFFGVSFSFEYLNWKWISCICIIGLLGLAIKTIYEEEKFRLEIEEFVDKK